MIVDTMGGNSRRGTMQPRQKSDMELFTEAQEDLKEAVNMIDYYTKKKIHAEKLMEETVGNVYGKRNKESKT